MNYEDQITKLRFKIVECFGGEEKVKLTADINRILTLQKRLLIKQIEKNLFDIDLC